MESGQAKTELDVGHVTMELPRFVFGDRLGPVAEEVRLLQGLRLHFFFPSTLSVIA